MSNRDVFIGALGAVIGGIAVGVTLSYIEKSSRLTAIEVSQKQVEALTEKVVELRVQTKLASFQLNQTKKLAEEKSKEINDIAIEIRKRKSSIDKIDIIKALDGRVGEFKEIASSIVKEEIESAGKVWVPIQYEASLEFKSECQYKFIDENEASVLHLTVVFSDLLLSPPFYLDDTFHTVRVEVETPTKLRTKEIPMGNKEEKEVEIEQGVLYELCFNK